MTALIFLDLETTGLNPELDAILEVAYLVVDAETLKELDAFETTIYFEPDFTMIPPRVVEMHTKTGLWEDLWKGDALESVLDRLQTLFEESPGAVLCGRNVGTFDRRFLEAKRPGITGKLSHRNLDVSTLLAVRRWWQNNPDRLPEPEGTLHRAMADVRNDLETLRFIRDEYQAW